MPLQNRQLLQLCFGCSGYGIRAQKFLGFKFSLVLPERGIKYIKVGKDIKVYKYFQCWELNPGPHAYS